MNDRPGGLLDNFGIGRIQKIVENFLVDGSDQIPVPSNHGFGNMTGPISRDLEAGVYRLDLPPDSRPNFLSGQVHRKRMEISLSPFDLHIHQSCHPSPKVLFKQFNLER